MTFANIAKDLIQTLEEASFTCKLVALNTNGGRNNCFDASSLQKTLVDILNQKYPNANFEVEKEVSALSQMSCGCPNILQTIKIGRDRLDIHGVIDGVNVVIELDSSRADQVAKKMLSRNAFFKDDKLIYISVIYPGTDKMNLNEAKKYISYGKHLLDVPGKTKIIGMAIDPSDRNRCTKEICHLKEIQ